jgi:hypothetical protein
MADSDTEDINPSPFILEEWIGKGRKIPTAEWGRKLTYSNFLRPDPWCG